MRVVAGADDHQDEVRVRHAGNQIRDLVLIGGVEIDRPDAPGRRLRLDAELRHTVAGSTPGCAMRASRAASSNDCSGGSTREADHAPLMRRIHAGRRRARSSSARSARSSRCRAMMPLSVETSVSFVRSTIVLSWSDASCIAKPSIPLKVRPSRWAAVHQVVVVLVGKRAIGAGHVLDVNPLAVTHRGDLVIGERARRVVVEAPRPAVVVVNRNPQVAMDRVAPRGGIIV